MRHSPGCSSPNPTLGQLSRKSRPADSPKPASEPLNLKATPLPTAPQRESLRPCVKSSTYKAGNSRFRRQRPVSAFTCVEPKVRSNPPPNPSAGRSCERRRDGRLQVGALLFGRLPLIFFRSPVDDPDEPIQLRPSRRPAPPRDFLSGALNSWPNQTSPDRASTSAPRNSQVRSASPTRPERSRRRRSGPRRKTIRISICRD